MTDDLLLEPSRGEGPVGTGVHVLRRTQAPSGNTIADVWLTVLFMPVVPLGRWTLEPRGAATPSWALAHVAGPRPSRSLAWMAGGALAAVSSLLPAYLAISLFTGSKAIELGGLFSSAAAIVGTLGWLDETRGRVPLGTAVRALGRPAKSPRQGA